MPDMVVMRTVLDVPDTVTVRGLRSAYMKLATAAGVCIVRDDDALPIQVAVEFMLDGATPEELVRAGLQLSGVSSQLDSELSGVGLPTIDTNQIWLSPGLALNRDDHGREIAEATCPLCEAESNRPCHLVVGQTEDINTLLAFIHTERQAT